MQRRKKKVLISSLGLGDAKKVDRNTLPGIIFVFGCIIVAIIIETVIKKPDYSTVTVNSGFILFLAGILLRLVSQHQIGKHFSMTIRIRKDHRLIDTGLYRYIRHPMYTGFGMMTLGLCIMMQSYSALTITLTTFPFLGYYRVKYEEEALTLKLGNKYKEYMKRTKRFIPYLW